MLEAGIEYNTPANLRTFLNYMFGRKNMLTENDFSKEELDALRQAIYNKNFENKYYNDLGISNRLNEFNNANIAEDNKPINKVLNKLGLYRNWKPIDANRYLDNNISYENYKPILGDNNQITSGTGANTREAVNNMFNPSYTMQTSVGRARYMIDPAGYVTLEDTYNINPKTKMEGVIPNMFHAIAKGAGRLGLANEFDTRLRLGNINDWNMKYTGNPMLGIMGE